MGFFDTLKVMKDIVSGGIASYKAGEKLDELIEKATYDYEELFSSEEASLYRKYEKSKKDYDDNTNSDKNDDLLKRLEDDRINFLEALTKNSSLVRSFRDEIQTAIEEFKKADNLALDSLGEVLEKHAESDEQRDEVRQKIDDFKRK